MINSYVYRTNNADFRIFSSKKIMLYKEMQIICLTEMTTGEYKFPNGVKEIFLLKLDLWFRFLLDIERYFINCRRDFIREDNIKYILSACELTYDKYNSIIKDEIKNNNFDMKVYKVWFDIHEPLYKLLIDTIKKQKTIDSFTAFTNITDTLTLILNSTLYELFEIVNLEGLYINTKEDVKFVCYTDICPIYNKNYGSDDDYVPLIVQKINIYKKEYDIDKIYIKDFSTKGIGKLALSKLREIIDVDLEKTITFDYE